MAFEDFLTFRRYITPAFIVIIYIIGAIAITILSFIMIAVGFSAPSYYGISFGGIYVFFGIILLTLGNIFWRIFCEYLIITFRIYDEVASINKRLRPVEEQAQLLPPPPTATLSTQFCPACGSPLTYVSQYQRWYCYKCGKYM